MKKLLTVTLVVLLAACSKKSTTNEVAEKLKGKWYKTKEEVYDFNYHYMGKDTVITYQSYTAGSYIDFKNGAPTGGNVAFTVLPYGDKGVTVPLVDTLTWDYFAPEKHVNIGDGKSGYSFLIPSISNTELILKYQLMGEANYVLTYYHK